MPADDYVDSDDEEVLLSEAFGEADEVFEKPKKLEVDKDLAKASVKPKRLKLEVTDITGGKVGTSWFCSKALCRERGLVPAFPHTLSLNSLPPRTHSLPHSPPPPPNHYHRASSPCVASSPT